MTPWRLVLLVDEPAPGTALLAAEGPGEQVAASVWSYLYGAEGTRAVARHKSSWTTWLADRTTSETR
ncbi:MAG: hypothetical protein ACRCYU_17025 [Nocardioides sp.]